MKLRLQRGSGSMGLSLQLESLPLRLQIGRGK